MKRLFDFFSALFGLLALSPFLLPLIYLIWRQDKRSPFYISWRIGKDERPFRLVKLRSMCYGADKTGVDSTSDNDMRITAVGHFIRRFKLDEIPQLWNVLKGEMSLVGPRPNVERETDLYTSVEKTLLSVRPGITGVSSIVFADEGRILADKEDPDISYNQLIRPWKGYLGIFYIQHQSFWFDVQLVRLTVLTIISRQRALQQLESLLAKKGASQQLREIAMRQLDLVPTPPPGMDMIVTTRQVEIVS